MKNPNRTRIGLGIIDAYLTDAAFVADVGAAQRGDFYLNSTTSRLRLFDGANWADVSAAKLVARAIDFSFSTPPSGSQTVDGLTVNAGDLVVLAAASTPGVYTVQTGTWTIFPYSDPAGTPSFGDLVRISSGTAYSNSLFMFTGSTWLLINMTRAGTTANTLAVWSGDHWVENVGILAQANVLHGVDSSAADSVAASNIFVNGGNKTAGTGNGGDAIVSGGTSFGGLRGKVRLAGYLLNIGPNAASDPVTGVVAQDVYYNTTEGRFKYFDGTAWLPMAGGTGLEPVTYVDSSSTTLPSSTPYTPDGVGIATGDNVLFTALSSGNNQIYKASVSGSAITWTLQRLGQNPSGAPTNGDVAFVKAGNTYAETIWYFDGTAWRNYLQYINESLVPKTTLAYDIGSASFRWRDLYLSGSTIYLNTTATINASTMKTTDQSSASTNSAAYTFQSGNATGTTSNSGDVTVKSGTATGTRGKVKMDGSVLNLGFSASSDPATNLATGDVYYSTTETRFKFYDGANWRAVGGGSGLAVIQYIDTAATSLPTVLGSGANMLVFQLNAFGAGDGLNIDGNLHFFTGTSIANEIANYISYYSGFPAYVVTAIGTNSMGIRRVDAAAITYGVAGNWTIFNAYFGPDGVQLANNDVVLFTALSSSNNQIYKAAISGTTISWTLQHLGQNPSGAPTDGDGVYITKGTAYHDTIWFFNGTSWYDYNGDFANLTLSNLTSPTAINQDLTFANAAHAVKIASPTSTAGGSALTVQSGNAFGSQQVGADLYLKAGAGTQGNSGGLAANSGKIHIQAHTTGFSEAAGSTVQTPVDILLIEPQVNSTCQMTFGFGANALRMALADNSTGNMQMYTVSQTQFNIFGGVPSYGGFQPASVRLNGAAAGSAILRGGDGSSSNGGLAQITGGPGAGSQKVGGDLYLSAGAGTQGNSGGLASNSGRIIMQAHTNTFFESAGTTLQTPTTIFLIEPLVNGTSQFTMGLSGGAQMQFQVNSNNDGHFRFQPLSSSCTFDIHGGTFSYGGLNKPTLSLSSQGNTASLYSGDVSGTNVNGGATYVQSGQSTGNGSASVFIYAVAGNQGTGTTQRPSTQIVEFQGDRMRLGTASLYAEFIPLTQFTIADNQSSAATVFSVASASFTHLFVEYGIVKSGKYKTGLVTIANDGSVTPGIADSAGASNGDAGVTFSATVSGGNLLLQYTSTSTGAAGTMKYTVRRW